MPAAQLSPGTIKSSFNLRHGTLLLLLVGLLLNLLFNFPVKRFQELILFLNHFEHLVQLIVSFLHFVALELLQLLVLLLLLLLLFLSDVAGRCCEQIRILNHVAFGFTDLETFNCILGFFLIGLLPLLTLRVFIRVHVNQR